MSWLSDRIVNAYFSFLLSSEVVVVDHTFAYALYPSHAFFIPPEKRLRTKYYSFTALRSTPCVLLSIHKSSHFALLELYLSGEATVLYDSLYLTERFSRTIGFIVSWVSTVKNDLKLQTLFFRDWTYVHDSSLCIQQTNSNNCGV